MNSNIATEKEMEIERAVKRGYSECMDNTMHVLNTFQKDLNLLCKKKMEIMDYPGELIDFMDLTQNLIDNIVNAWSQKYNSDCFAVTGESFDCFFCKKNLYDCIPPLLSFTKTKGKFFPMCVDCYKENIREFVI